jgi:hypothetical protein
MSVRQRSAKMLGRLDRYAPALLTKRAQDDSLDIWRKPWKRKDDSTKGTVVPTLPQQHSGLNIGVVGDK